MQLRSTFILAVLLFQTAIGFAQSTLQESTARGKNVYVLAEDAAVEYAKKSLSNWGYWNIVSTQDSADFILKFNLTRIGLTGMDFQAFSEFLDPKTNNVFKVTSSVNTKYSTDFNARRGVVNKLIRKRIRPEFR